MTRSEKHSTSLIEHTKQKRPAFAGLFLIDEVLHHQYKCVDGSANRK